MKRILLFCVTVVVLVGMMSAAVSAQEITSVNDIPVAVRQEMPKAVEDLLCKAVWIKDTERLSEKEIRFAIDSCTEQLAKNAIVKVSTETIKKLPPLRFCSTVEVSTDYVYATDYSLGVKTEWMYYLDGTVQKTVSCEYEERTSAFKPYTYSIVNDNNTSLEQYRVEIKESRFTFHLQDFLFGMAAAVLLMMIGVIIVRAVKKA